jgi:hypothetical protein
MGCLPRFRLASLIASRAKVYIDPTHGDCRSFPSVKIDGYREWPFLGSCSGKYDAWTINQEFLVRCSMLSPFENL